MYVLLKELAEFESEREEVKKLEQRLVEVENTLQQKRENKKGENILTQHSTMYVRVS